MELEVGKDRWVTVEYRIFDSDGEPIEEGERTLTYLHGSHGELFEALEQALEGQPVGHRASVYLDPDQSFGDYDASLVRLAPRAAFPDELEPGMSFEGIPGEAADGRIWIVTDLAADQVVLDGNHPLAGMALRFELEVIDVAEASEEEIRARREQA